MKNLVPWVSEGLNSVESAVTANKRVAERPVSEGLNSVERRLNLERV